MSGDDIVGGGRPVLVVFAGLPGTGKSTLADAVAQWLQAPVFKDELEATLVAIRNWPRSQLGLGRLRLSATCGAPWLNGCNSALRGALDDPRAVGLQPALGLHTRREARFATGMRSVRPRRWL